MALIGTIRENLTGTLSKIIVALIAITFAMFFGWGTMFSNSDTNVVVSVNDKKIDLYDLDLEMARVQSILLQRFDDPDFQIEEENLKSLAINSLITEAIIVDFLKQNNVVVSPSTAYKLLSQNEIFLEDGTLSLAKIETYARQNGFLPSKYIENIRDDIAVNYWRFGLSNSSFLTESELKKNIELANQTRDITFTKIDKTEVEEDISVEAKDVKEFYQKNPSLFQSLEKAKIKYIELDLKSIESEISLTEEEIKREYQDYLSSFDDTTRRLVSHLMLNIDESRDKQASITLANKLRDELNKGKKFEDLVKEYSDDEGTKNTGGSLGITDGTSFPEEFELVIKEMKEGEISKAVILETSIHILKLQEIQTPVAEDFESKKKEIQQNLTQQIAFTNYIDFLDVASESLFLNEDIEGLAKDLGLEIKTKDYFSEEDSEGIFKESKLQKLIFGDPAFKEGTISDLIEINDQYALVLEMEDFKDIELKEFEEVKEEAEGLFLNSLVENKIQLIRQEILTQLQSGKSLEEVSAEKGLKIESYKSLTRSSSLFTQTTLTAIFNEPKVNMGKGYSSAVMFNGDILIFRLDEVGTANALPSKEDEEVFRNFFLQERSESEIADLQINMQEDASVLIN